jgi:hypothetical protein
MEAKCGAILKFFQGRIESNRAAFLVARSICPRVALTDHRGAHGLAVALDSAAVEIESKGRG